MITFGWNITEQFIEIEVLPDDERSEMREAFTVHITMDENMIAEVQVGIDRGCGKCGLLFLIGANRTHFKENSRTMVLLC